MIEFDKVQFLKAFVAQIKSTNYYKDLVVLAGQKGNGLKTHLEKNEDHAPEKGETGEYNSGGLLWNIRRELRSVSGEHYSAELTEEAVKAVLGSLAKK